MDARDHNHNVKALTADIIASYVQPESIFEHAGYDIRWSGWRDSPHHILPFGFWMAWNDVIADIRFSTAYGMAGKLTNLMEAVPILVSEDVKRRYPHLMLLTTKDRELLAKEAAWRLLKMLQA